MTQTSTDLPPVEQLINQLQSFMDEYIYPNEERYQEQLNNLENRFSTVPLMEELKARARDLGMWNLWMPKNHGGLSNEDYCALAEMMGRVLWAPEVFNCNAPDTGNMEVFMKYGTEAQKAEWLEPLLSGEIRSSYCMNRMSRPVMRLMFARPSFKMATIMSSTEKNGLLPMRLMSEQRYLLLWASLMQTIRTAICNKARSWCQSTRRV